MTPEPALRDDGPTRPAPALGVGVTLLVAGGRVHGLDAALARLAASARAVHGVEVPASLRGELGRLGAAGARVRAEVDAEGAARVRSAPFDPPPPGGPAVALVPFALPGGLGAHDWADRRLARDLGRRTGDGGVALLVEPDGEVLGVLDGLLLVARADGSVVTPASDGRHPETVDADGLPVTAAVPLRLDDLAAAARLIVVDALHGPRTATVASAAT